MVKNKKNIVTLCNCKNDAYVIKNKCTNQYLLSIFNDFDVGYKEFYFTKDVNEALRVDINDKEGAIDLIKNAEKFGYENLTPVIISIKTIITTDSNRSF